MGRAGMSAGIVVSLESWGGPSFPLECASALAVLTRGITDHC